MRGDRKVTTVSKLDFIKLFPESKLLFDYFPDKVLVELEQDNGVDYYWLTLETRFNMQYNIRVNKCKDGHIYFGGWSTNRLVQPFETWHRGNDLSDGDLNDKTIMRFVRDVIDDIFVNAPQEDKFKHSQLQGIRFPNED
jgi:hypothetical protein